MKLFPYVLIRVSGGEFARFQALELPQSAQVVQKVQACQNQMTALKERLSQALYDVVAHADQDHRLTFIQLRRDIHNEREIAAERCTAVAGHLPPDVYADVLRYNNLWKQARCLWEHGEMIYEDEMTAARETLRQLSQRDNLQMGLLLSSQSLFKYGIPHYVQSRQLKKQGLKTEQSLIKYLSRIYAKTSPFSTFTHLTFGHIVPHIKTGFPTLLCPNGSGDTAVVNHIRLNNYLYQYLKNLLTKNRDIYCWFELRPNPTLSLQGEHYVFLTNSNNIESFQRIAATPALKLLYTLTADQPDGMTYQTIIETIVKNESIDAADDEIADYIDQLVDYGFLEFNLGVSGTDPDWDLKLCQKLHPYREQLPLLNELGQTLGQMRHYARAYGRAPVAERTHILHEAFETFRAICMDLHQATGLPEEERKTEKELRAILAQKKEDGEGTAVSETEVPFKHQAATFFYFRPEHIFYEDSTRSTSLTLDEHEAMCLTNPLPPLLQAVPLFDGLNDEQDKMYHYFQEKYGLDSTVTLLHFYEDYYRDVKKPEAEASQRPTGSASEEAVDGTAQPVIVPAIKERAAVQQKWLQLFVDQFQTAVSEAPSVVNISLAHIQNVNQCAGVLPPANGQPSSYGAFIQPFYDCHEDGSPQLMGVVNATFPGFGKMVSRFLHLFDPTITEELQHWNNSLASKALLVENSDASYFNANLHPALLPFEIWMPGGHNMLPPAQQIPVTDLSVGINADGTRLQLFHRPSQKPVYIFDLGFQGMRGRSPLFQLLNKFTLAKYPWFAPLLNAINKHVYPPDRDKKSVDHWKLPRIVYEERLVLQRQAWHFPRELLPLRQPQEGEWAYFNRLNQWRLVHEIPHEVFVYIYNRNEVANHPHPSPRARIGRDDYKPQYISFHNPFLVTLFEKLLHKVPDTLKIEEMLPGSEQLLVFEQEKRVTEFVFQWYQGEERL